MFSAKFEAAPPSLLVICFLQGASSEELARPGRRRSHTTPLSEGKALNCSQIHSVFQHFNQSELQGLNLEVCGWTDLLVGSEITIASATAFATE